MAYEIAVVPGDGVGIEVVDATVPLFDALEEAFGIEVETTRYDWGCHRHLEEGAPMPDDALDRLAGYDAILHGATGHPDVPERVQAHEMVLPIRKEFDHYVNLRPAYLFDGVKSELRSPESGDVDIRFYRENTEGFYADIGGDLYRGEQTDLAVQSGVFTRDGIERIVHAAFDEARSREQHVTSITKSNAIQHGFALWDEVVESVSDEYPDVELDDVRVDAACQHLVLNPGRFDVVVGSNLFGDVLTDLTAAVTGGLGLTPSANVNPDNETPGMYEPVHGSGPDIAGEGIANPIATLLSVGLMMDDLAEQKASDAIWNAVEAHLSDGTAPHTPDIGGCGTTEAVSEDIRSRVS